MVAERSGIMSKKVNASIIGVIENMSHMEVEGKNFTHLEKMVEKTYLKNKCT